tara:strand:- start:34 stop:483 length:450 start_codon:yes stop_codon:yes gene_type:complete
MDGQKREFLVIRCTNCESHFGSLSSKETHCPNCGEFGSHPIVDRAKDDRDLSNRVALSNVPTDLRPELEKKLRIIDKYEDFDDVITPPRRLMKILTNTINEDGIIEIEKIDSELKRLVIDSPNAEELVDMAESQGLLMRHSKDSWIWLG